MATNAGKIDFSSDLGQAFCEHIAEGGTVRGFCAQPGAPSKAAIFRWLRREPEFAATYALALQWRGEVLADEMIDLADDTTADPRQVRNQLSARMWLAERLAPKRYGTKQALEHSGEVKTVVEIVNF